MNQKYFNIYWATENRPGRIEIMIQESIGELLIVGT